MKRLCVAALLAASMACVSLDSFLFSPTTVTSYEFPADDASATRELLPLTTEDGVKIWALWLPRRPEAPSHRAGAILYCHGNGQNMQDYYWRVKLLRDLGWDVLMFDYRGYGASEGPPTEPGLYADARAALAELRRRTSAPVVYYGWSLGAAICTQLALEEPPQVLHLDSPFGSVERILAENSDLPLSPATVSQWRFDNFAKIGRIAAPVQIFHGDADRTMPLRFGEDLHQLAQDPKQLWVVRGADHDSIPQAPGYADCLASFLDSPETAGPCAAVP